MCLCTTCVQNRAAHHLEPELQVVLSCPMGCLEPVKSVPEQYLPTEVSPQLQVLSLKVISERFSLRQLEMGRIFPQKLYFKKVVMSPKYVWEVLCHGYVTDLVLFCCFKLFCNESEEPIL